MGRGGLAATYGSTEYYYGSLITVRVMHQPGLLVYLGVDSSHLKDIYGDGGP